MKKNVVRWNNEGLEKNIFETRKSNKGGRGRPPLIFQNKISQVWVGFMHYEFTDRFLDYTAYKS